MTTNLTYAAEAASGKTLEALAQVIRALAPEVSGVSFHDFAADTLWLSEDFLLPEDHQLVEDSLSSDSGGNLEVSYAPREDGNYSLAIPVRDSQGAINGAVRLSIDGSIKDTRTDETLEQKLAPVFVCLSAEFERRQGFPLLISEDTQEGAQIENALHAERFELFLQPICSLHDNVGLAHYEVLLRLRTANGNLIQPKEFLARAAQQRLMPNIDRWVVRTLLVWLTNNRKLWARVPSVFSINLSSQSMTDDGFVSYVESCVLKSGLPPQALCFDITERFAASGSISVAESMKRLEALGCEVALDDFGANPPAYGYLRSVPAHYFKIDSSLVEAAPTDRVARAMISAIVRMAGDLGVQTVAEAVESDVELQAVRSLGVDFAQGYLLGKPESLSGYDFSAAAIN
ncbi:MAG TPA: EAL domain-containing protein [Steroidobacteraceae bacterium]|nr:EAL domain-containing protein [Steroidobacteraceae bacterium]